MKITTKINLLTTAWMLCIMILINMVVYFSFMKITINTEEDSQYQKAEDIVKELNKLNPSSQDRELSEFLSDHSYIRIMEPKNKIIYEVKNDSFLSKKIKAKFVETKQAQTRIISAEHGEDEVLIVRVPLKKQNQITASLEMGERLTGLEARKELLRILLGLCTILAAFLSIIGGRWLANLIMRPISNMITTMEEIEKSGVPQKLITKERTKDELQTMARTFNRMIDRLQENFEKQKQFVSDASHELKTPLTVIMSYANFLRRHGTENKEMAAEAIQAIHSEATRMKKMTETFLDLANLEKETVLEISDVNLVTLCQNIVKQLKDVYKREILLHYEIDSIMIHADELKIKQVIIILLDNALKYSNEAIDMFLEKGEKNVIIRVKDYGIGIPHEEMNNVYERFYRVDKARSRETGGTGLGLYIAKSIMKLHKGEIHITSKEGAGTEVVLLFPV